MVLQGVAIDEKARVAWLLRRAGLGAAPGSLDRGVAMGSAALLDQLVDPATHGVAAAVDPWADDDLTYSNDPKERRARTATLIQHWLDLMVATPRPLEEAMVWFWHDHFAVSLAEVKVPSAMADHLRLLRRHALGDFRTLLREITTDPAMLVFLDGATSTGTSPNENYGREMLELYTLGVGYYGESDVRSAALALTGWTVQVRKGGAAVFAPKRHDDATQTLLGRPVHDVESVVSVVLAQPALPTFIAGKIARWFLGAGATDAVIAKAAAAFTASSLSIAAAVRSVLQSGLDMVGTDAAAEVVRPPVPWLAAVAKATGAPIDLTAMYSQLLAAGQLPCFPPNVGGWPGTSAWLGASATTARVSLAAMLVDRLPVDAPALRLAATRDLSALATLLGRPEGFGPATTAALMPMSVSGPRSGAGLLTIALSSPDVLVG
jgi:uncharacterized protein (DUF1800 family)